MGKKAGKKEEDKTERVTGRGRKTKETVKWSQMTALRFQTGGETSYIPSLFSGDFNE